MGDTSGDCRPPAHGSAELDAGSGSVRRGGSAHTPLGGAPARFLIATTLSSYGDWLSAVAVMVALFQLTGSFAASAAYTVIRVGPRLAGAGPGGALVDRFGPSRVIVLGAGAQALFTVGILAGCTWRLPWLVYVAVGLCQLCSSATRPAHPAVIAQLVVGDARRQRANAVYGAGLSSSVLVAPALGALLLNVVGAQWVIALDGLSFVVVMLLMAGITTRRPGDESRGVRSGLREGAYLLLGQPVLRVFMVANAAGALAITATQSVMVAATTEHFGGPGDVGWLYSSVGAGALAGAAAAGRWCPSRMTPRRMLIAFLAEITGLMMFAVSPNLAVAMIVLAIGSAFGAVYDTWGTTELQRVVDARSVGRAFGALFQAMNTGLIVGAIAGLALVSVVSWQIVVAGSAALAGLLGFAAFLAGSSSRKSVSMVPADATASWRAS